MDWQVRGLNQGNSLLTIDKKRGISFGNIGTERLENASGKSD